MKTKTQNNDLGGLTDPFEGMQHKIVGKYDD